MKKIYSSVFTAIALLSAVLLFTSCGKETPSVGSSQNLGGEWECIEAPSNIDAFFIKGDIISFDSGIYELVHPDGKKRTGAFYLNGIYLNLIPDGSKAILFTVNGNDTILTLRQDTGISFYFQKIKKKYT